VSEFRASDADRDRAAQQIREHFAAGRLTEDEMTERVEAAYAARTESELRGLLLDLPQLPATRAEQRAELAARRRHLQRRLIQQTGGGLALVVVCVAVWLINGAQGQFWPVWVMLIVLLPLIRNGWRLYGPAPDFERVEAELARRERGRRHDRERHRHG
jgi:cation transport ATPase